MWAMASGGMSPLEVLRAATINGAEEIGHGLDFGSLEVGKLADLQVLTNNPLENIHNTVTTKYVMKNGRLYDALTLDEIYPQVKHFGSQWWQSH
jgi:imidazolonepropionase-like amidohydrolase